MSLRDAEALLVLPHSHSGKTKALRGEVYPVLLLNNALNLKPVRVRNSVHLKKPSKGTRLSVIEVLPPEMKHLSKLEETCAKVQDAMSGSKSGNAAVVSKRTFHDVVENLYAFIAQESSDDVDVIVICCVSFDGSFRYHLDVANTLRKHLTKVANSLSLQARQGAASQDPKAALFEVTVGYVSERQAILLCVPDIGAEGAIRNVRGLLKHGLNVARGKAHNHHHAHQHH
jgi:hypothetical protein